MLREQPSRTVLRPAILRAAHQVLDTPLIFADPIAVGLVSQASKQAILAAADDFRSQQVTSLRSLMVLRSRFAEDRLAEASVRGVRQYVILGAGLDTFPWRQPVFAHQTRIFVADHPATLSWTRQRLRERGLSRPSNLAFVPVDLEERRLLERLAEVGFDPRVPTFCSALGLIQYLSSSAADALLEFGTLLPSGSEFTFTFALPGEELHGDDVDEASGSASRSEVLREPWKSRHRAGDLVERFARLGFTDIFHLTPDLAQQRYFSGRQDALRVPRFEQLISAIV